MKNWKDFLKAFLDENPAFKEQWFSNKLVREFSHFLTEMRIKNKWNQRQLAKELKVSPSTISRWESVESKISANRICSIMYKFGYKCNLTWEKLQ